MKQYVCRICGFVYDEAAGLPDSGIAPGTRWDDLPHGWVCPVCSAPMDDFNVKEEATSGAKPTVMAVTPSTKGLSPAALSAVFSNLAKGAEKQYKPDVQALYNQLADYYKNQAGTADGNLTELGEMQNKDIDHIASANQVATVKKDRGAKRALKWSDKVCRMQAILVDRFNKQGSSAFADSDIHICEICGFVYVGKALPHVCPVCKVPNYKMPKVARRLS